MSRDRTAGRATLLSALRRHPAVVVMSAIAAGLVGAGIGLSFPASYTAQAHVVVSSDDRVVSSAEDSADSPEEIAQLAAQLMVGEAVTRAAGARVPGRLDPQAVGEAISVAPSRDSGLVTVTATGSTPAGASALANAVGETYLELAAAENAERYALRIERLEAERQGLLTELTDVWATFSSRSAAVRARTGASSTISVVISADPVLQQLRENGGRLAERLSEVERSIVEAEANTALEPIEQQRLLRAGDPPSERGAVVRRSAGLAVPLGVILGAGLAWRRVEREGTTAANLASRVRILGRLPAPSARRDRIVDARTLGLWRQLRLVTTARHLDDLVVLELPSPRRSRGAAQPLLDAARVDGCAVRDDLAGSRSRHRAAADGGRSPGVGAPRVVEARSTAVLSSVPTPRRTGVVVVGVPSPALDSDVRATEALVTAAGAQFLGVVVGRAARRRGTLRLPLTHAGADSASPETAASRGDTDAR